MIPKNILNVNQLLLMMLFTATLFDPLFADKTFMISNDNRSAKAIVGTDKKIEVKLALNSNDYNEGHSFSLSVGGCTLSVKAEKHPGSSTVGFVFYNGKVSKSVENPKSFEIIGQELIFANSIDNDKDTVKCEQSINFVSMDGKLILDVSLAGDIPQNLVLTSKNLVYNGSVDSNLVLYVCIGVGILVALLVVSAAAGIAAFYINRRKQKAAAAKKSKEQLKTAVSAEKTKVSTAKELSEQKSSKKPALVKDVKQAKAAPRDLKQSLVSDFKKNLDIVAMKVKEDQSNAPPVAAEEEDPMEAKPQVVEEMPKPAIETQPPQLESMPKLLLEAKPQIVEEKPMPAMEANPQLENMSKPSLETQPQLESMPKPSLETQPQLEEKPKPLLEANPQLESMPKPVMETQPPQVEEKPKPSLEMQQSQIEEGPKPSLETQSQVEEPNPRRIRKKRSKSSKKSRSRKSSKRRKRSRKAPRWRLRKSQHELQAEERQKEEARKNEKLKEEAESNSEMKRHSEENDGLKTAEDDESAANQGAKEQDEK